MFRVDADDILSSLVFCTAPTAELQSKSELGGTLI